MNSWWNKIAEHEKMRLVYWLLEKDILDIPVFRDTSPSVVNIQSDLNDIDWDYAFYDPLYDNVETEMGDLPHASNIERIVFTLQDMEKTGGTAQLIASQLLQIKYWCRKDMEIQISPMDPTTLSYVEATVPVAFLKKLYHRLKSNAMKEEVFVYLSNEIKYGGFNEKIIPALQQALQAGGEKFQLEQTTQIGKDTVTATLYFNKGKEEGMYFFNAFDLKVAPGGNEEWSYVQHIPRSREAKFTLKQGYNIAQGRPVGFVHIDDNKKAYEIWAVLDKKFSYENGSPHIKLLPANYKYAIEDTLVKYNILNMKDEDEKTALLNSIRRGNLTEATVERSDGFTTKVLITANPLARVANFHNHATGERINRNDFLHPSAPTQEISSPSKSATQSPGEMEAPDLPEGKKKTLKK